MSGLLAGIYSAGDRMKRKLGGLLSNPLETVALGSTRMAEDVNALSALASEAGYMPRTVNRGDQSVLVSERQKALARALLAEKATEMGGAMMGATKFVYPQEQALLTAQRNAAKPVSEGGLGLRPNNTPAERAAAMGFDFDGFHGTNRNFSAFNNDMLGVKTGAKSAQKAHFLARTPETSNGYVNLNHVHNQNAPMYAAMMKNKRAFDEFNATDDEAARWAILEKYGFNRGSGQVLPLTVNTGKQRIKDYQGTGYRDVTYNEEIKAAKKGGKDSVLFKNTTDPGPDPAYRERTDILAVFDPSRIRSRFAAFDPMRRDSPDLLAGALPFTAMADEDSRLQILDILKRNGVPIK